jgi:hypothetical protein
MMISRDGVNSLSSSGDDYEGIELCRFWSTKLDLQGTAFTPSSSEQLDIILTAEL